MFFSFFQVSFYFSFDCNSKFHSDIFLNFNFNFNFCFSIFEVCKLWNLFNMFGTCIICPTVYILYGLHTACLVPIYVSTGYILYGLHTVKYNYVRNAFTELLCVTSFLPCCLDILPPLVSYFCISKGYIFLFTQCICRLFCDSLVR